MPEKNDASAQKRFDVILPKKEKQPVTIRLTPAAIDRLSEIERDLRRAGVRARQASVSEIVEALINAAETSELVDVLRPRG